MKPLYKYITEKKIEPEVSVYRLYRVNIGRMWEERDGTRHKIGEITEITRGNYSDFTKSFTFCETMKNGDSRYAIEIKPLYLGSIKVCENYLAELNNKDEFYHYFLDKETATKSAEAAKNKFVNTKWTWESLLHAINNYIPLKKLGYNFKITTTFQQRDNVEIKSIYVSRMWRIRLVDNKYIELDNAGWHTYRVPNIPSLYKVLNAENDYSDSSDIETTRQKYSIIR